jgi:hypothetical protein
MIITSSSDEKVQYLKAQYDAYYIINYKTTPPGQLLPRRGCLVVDNVVSIVLGFKVLNLLVGRRCYNSPVNFILEGGSGTIKQSLDAIAFRGVVWF